VAGLVGMDLVPMVTSGQRFTWDETPGFGSGLRPPEHAEFHVVAIDYGISATSCGSWRNGCKVTVVPATTAADDIIALSPTASSSPTAPAIRRRPANMPCGDPHADRPEHPDLRHLPRPPDARHRGRRAHDEDAPGHHGANHPVKDLVTGKVEITR